MKPEGFLSAAEAQVTHFRGPMARMVRNALRRGAGEEAWARMLQGLDAEAQRLGSEDAELSDWVPVAPVVAWANAFREAMGPTPLGRDLIEQLLDDAHPWIQKTLGPTMAVEALPRLIRHYNRGGELVVESVVPGEAVLDLWAHLAYPGWHDHLIPAAMARTVERCGGRDVAIAMLPPGPLDPPFRHRFRLTWR